MKIKFAKPAFTIGKKARKIEKRIGELSKAEVKLTRRVGSHVEVVSSDGTVVRSLAAKPKAKPTKAAKPAMKAKMPAGRSVTVFNSKGQQVGYMSPPPAAFTSHPTLGRKAAGSFTKTVYPC